MRVDRSNPWELRRAPAEGESVSSASHRHPSWRLSRRRFLHAAAGATAVGAVGRSALLTDVARAAGPPGIGQVLPIPTTVEFFPGVESHVLAPPFLFGPDSDPATVYNFQGAAGLAFISGSVDRTDRTTGETRTLPYLFNDMRFMKGVFRGRDGLERSATFAFI